MAFDPRSWSSTRGSFALVPSHHHRKVRCKGPNHFVCQHADRIDCSPRYTVDIVRDDHQAAVDVDRYFYSGDHFSTESRDSFQQDHEDEFQAEGLNPIVPLSVMESDEMSQPPQASWSDIKEYFWHQGNYRTLLSTSLTWLSLDLAFYGLGMVCLHKPRPYVHPLSLFAERLYHSREDLDKQRPVRATIVSISSSQRMAKLVDRVTRSYTGQLSHAHLDQSFGTEDYPDQRLLLAIRPLSCDWH
jgi:hypothetical protein